jgi:GTPase
LLFWWKILADQNLRSLNKLQSLYQAENGQQGRSYNMKGKSGKHLTIKVPVGTVLKNQAGQLVYDLAQKGASFIAARGGAGGKGTI